MYGVCIAEILDDLNDKVGRTTARIERETRHVDKIRVKASDKGMARCLLRLPVSLFSVCLSICLPGWLIDSACHRSGCLSFCAIVCV